MAFYLRLERDGEDLYPELRRVLDDGRVPEGDRVRYELLRHFGYFVTESSEHFSEYTPWFIKSARPELVERFKIPLDEYLARCERQIAEWEELRESLFAGDGEIRTTPSHEYGAGIIRAIETGEDFEFNGNVPNAGRLVSNLAEDACVEVPCTANAAGIAPHAVGALPPQLAALIETNVSVQRLTVEAALTGNREHVYHAAALDPHTAAELPLDEIRELVDRLIDAHGDLLPQLRSPV
jgi:alpha-galactosidase